MTRPHDPFAPSIIVYLLAAVGLALIAVPVAIGYYIQRIGGKLWNGMN